MSDAITYPTIPLSTNLTGIGQGIGLGSDIIGSFIPLKKEYLSRKGAITAGIDSGWNTLADAASQFGPAGLAVGGLMKGAGLVGKGLNALGGGTDAMTTTDAILGSDIGTMLTLGLNGFFGKRADTMNKNYEDFAQVGSSYGGTEAQVDNALKYSGKKYGVFSSGARKKANNLMALAGLQQWKIGQIANDARIGHELQSNMADINERAYAFDRIGGYNQRAVIAARLGLKIEKARDILSKDVQFEDEEDDFTIDYSSINKSETPIFKEGGQMNLIPEGALHARKHNMDDPNLDGQITKKGIPVVIDKGLGEVEQVAEIEHSEIVFNKDTTTKLEELYSKFKEDISKSEKDALALEAGKLLTDLILNNTDDRVGLIDKV